MRKENLIRLKKYLYRNKTSLSVYFVLRGLVFLSLVRSYFRADYQSVFLCVLTLVLMLLPSVLSHKLDIHLPGALEVVILISSDGSQRALGIGGYLDVGNHDTMKDLLVNLIGAVVFSVNGYIAAARKGKSRIAVKFIPRVNPSEENEEASP